MATIIEKCFADIDQLQFSAFRIISSISNGQYLEDPTVIPEEARSSKVKEANEHIRQIPDLLRVVDVALNNIDSSDARTVYLQEKYELYSSKEGSLRETLKNAQLDAYAKENQAIHMQRLARYNCSVDSEEVTDVESNPKPLSTDLFAASSKTSRANGGKTVEDQITAHNKDITSSLKQTKQLMTLSVMQSELNIDSLDQQYKDLSNFNSKMMDMESLLLKSRQIVKFIERQDRQDKRRIYLAIGFLLLCSAWILWRRVLRAPVRILLWTLFKSLGVVNWIFAKSASSYSEKIDYDISSFSSSRFSEDVLPVTSTILTKGAQSLTSSLYSDIQKPELQQASSLQDYDNTVSSNLNYSVTTIVTDQDLGRENPKLAAEAISNEAASEEITGVKKYE